MDIYTLLRYCANYIKNIGKINNLHKLAQCYIALIIALIFKTLRQWPKLTEKTASDFGYSCFICYSAVEAIYKINGYYNQSNWDNI